MRGLTDRIPSRLVVRRVSVVQSLAERPDRPGSEHAGGADEEKPATSQSITVERSTDGDTEVEQLEDAVVES